MRPLTAVLLLAAIAAAGCQYPRDPDGTLNRVEGGVMRVGVSEADPWVVLDGDEPAGGAEVELARRFARDLGARIEWVQGSEEELVDAAKEGQVDLILAGLTSKSRWKKDVAFTRPYVDTRSVVGAPAGGSYPDDFAGVPVAVELGSEEEGLLEQRTDARVVPVTDLASRRRRAGRRARLPARRPRADRQWHRARRGQARDGGQAGRERVPGAARALPARTARTRSVAWSCGRDGRDALQPDTPRREFELPRELEEKQRKAVRLEWITLAYMLSAVVLLFLTLGQSQAMKAAWIEDLLSLLPPAAFLIASRIRKRDPSEKFPWGMHRAVSVAYVFAALALLAMGGYVFVDSAIKLVLAEHPPIGVVQLFGEEIWLGWLMIAALVYSGLPAVFLGRAKLRLADDLHDKVLYADAQMNKADWMTVTAAIVGIGRDRLRALVGRRRGRAVHLGRHRARRLEERARRCARPDGRAPAPPRRAREYHPIVERMNRAVNDCDWVERGAVRLREEGHVFTGEVMVVPRAQALSDGERLLDRLDELADHLLSLEWKVYDIVVVPVKEIDIPSPGVPGLPLGTRPAPARTRPAAVRTHRSRGRGRPPCARAG